MIKPNFSGKWKFNPELSTLQIKPPEATLIAIDHSENIFRLERTHTFASKEETFSIELKMDGTTEEITRGGLRIQARVYWEGNSLVFDTMLFTRNSHAANIVRYNLEESGNIITASEKFRSADINYDNLWVMEKI